MNVENKYSNLSEHDKKIIADLIEIMNKDDK